MKRNIPLSAAGFTLIEMLIVITIIAIIAALLMPSLRNSLEQGRIIGCLNNERQIYVAQTMYADDYNGYLMNLGRYGRGTLDSKGNTVFASNFWPVILLPYMGKTKVSGIGDCAGTAFFCPKQKETNVYRESTGVRNFNPAGCNLYGVNHRINGTQRDKQYQPARMNRIVNASKTVLTADGGTSGSNFDIADTYYARGSGAYSFNHFNYDFNGVLFCDGHAEKMHWFTYCKGTSADRIFTSYRSDY